MSRPNGNDKHKADVAEADNEATEALDRAQTCARDAADAGDEGAFHVATGQDADIPQAFDERYGAPFAPCHAQGAARALVARAVAAVCAVIIAFCGWSAWSYAQGGDPLAFLGSGAFQTMAEDEAAATTGAAATVAASDAAAAESDDAPSGESSEAAESGDEASTGDESAKGDDAGPGAKSSSGSKGGSSSNESDGDGSGSGSAGSGSGSGSSAGGSSSSSSSGSSSAGGSSSSYSGVTVYITVDGSSAGAGSASATVALGDGGTVYDALLAAGADVNASSTAYGMYVSAIGGLAEKEHGSMSGWMYSVNGYTPNVACSSYTLSDGDSIYWWYANVEY